MGGGVGPSLKLEFRERPHVCKDGDRELAVSVHKEACVARTRSTDLPFSSQDAHLSEVSAVRFGPNSSLLATGGADRLILLWNVVGGEGRCLQASSVLSLQTSLSACSLGKVLGLSVFPHPVILVGSGQMTPWQEFWAQCS